jgi:hypothetical protein
VESWGFWRGGVAAGDRPPICLREGLEEAMAADQHPQYPAWSKALDRLVEAERRYHIALMEKRTEDETQQAARDLDEARTRYQAIADQIE